MATKTQTQEQAHAPAAADEGDCRRPASLGALVEKIAALRAAPSFEELQGWLAAVRIGEEELRPYVNFRPRTYVRTRVIRNAHAEMLVLCWRPGHYTSIHDHNGSYSVIRVLSGEMHESLYDLDERDGLRPGAEHYWQPGHITTADIPDIHRIGNADRSGQDLVTLHCYSPPFDVINTYKLGSHERGLLRPEDPLEVQRSC
jgi:cysteine dioxygenase